MNNTTLEKMFYVAEKIIKKNAPTILAVAGAIGVAATSVITAKSVLKYDKVAKEVEDKVELTPANKIKIALPIYIPAVLVGVGTISCILGANVLNKRNQASLMSAYTLLDQSYRNYKRKVEEIYGPEATDRMSEEIAKEHYQNDNFQMNFEDKQLFYDMYSERYFESTMHDVMEAEYHFNRNFTLRGFANLNELYKFLGLEEVDYGYLVGWSMYAEGDYGYRWVDFTHQVIIMDDGLECCIVRFPFEPHTDYMDY